jgi:hypothetical protein
MVVTTLVASAGAVQAELRDPAVVSYVREVFITACVVRHQCVCGRGEA